MKKKANTLPTKKKQIKSPTKQTKEVDLSSLSKLILAGDLSGLTEDEKLKYYAALCKSLGLNPYTKPFDYITFERGNVRKEILYATKSAAEQLRKIHDISVIEEKREITETYVIYDVTVKDSTGRTDTGTGVVSLLKYDRNHNYVRMSGVELADAIMKAQTKAKRRATLSIAGLGMLDETEIEFTNTAPHEAEKQIQQGTNGILTRQANMDMFKKLPAEIRKLFVDKGVGLDEALAICNECEWDETTIRTKMEFGYDNKKIEDPF